MKAAATRRARVTFVVRFAVLLILFYVAVTPAVVDRIVISRISGAIAAASGSVLTLIGQNVHRNGTMLIGDGCALDIQNGCNGVEAIVFVCAAMIAFPATWRVRLLGVLTATFFIESLNIIRVVTLYLACRFRPALFDLLHLEVWQTLVFGAAVLSFVIWSRQATRTDAARS